MSPPGTPPSEAVRRSAGPGRRFSGALFASAALACVAPAHGQRVRVILSSDSRPYQDAMAGAKDVLGEDAAMSLADGAPATGDAQVVVAVGAKAALRSCPRSVRLIVAMAPSVPARRPGCGDTRRVAMTPEPQALLARMKALQPELKRLGVVWKSDFYGEEYLPLLRASARAAGIAVESYPLADEDGIPDQLRTIHGRVDALWLPPDPLVINERNFLLFRDFASSNRVPLYVPVPGLAERGATAAIGIPFREVGRAAGQAAKRLLEGGDPGALIFPAPLETTLNLKAATAIGLAPSPEALKTATRVLP